MAIVGILEFIGGACARPLVSGGIAQNLNGPGDGLGQRLRWRVSVLVWVRTCWVHCEMLRHGAGLSMAGFCCQRHAYAIGALLGVGADKLRARLKAARYGLPVCDFPALAVCKSGLV